MISGYDVRQNQRQTEDVSPKYDIMQIGRMVACDHNGDNDMGPLITIPMTMETMTMMIMGC